MPEKKNVKAVTDKERLKEEAAKSERFRIRSKQKPLTATRREKEEGHKKNQ